MSSGTIQLFARKLTNSMQFVQMTKRQIARGKIKRQTVDFMSREVYSSSPKSNDRFSGSTCRESLE
jgi:hypothetical protein